MTIIDELVRLFHWLHERKRPANDDEPYDPPGTPVEETEGGKLWALIIDETCPDCKQKTRFIAGPQGGLSQNIQCVKCGHWWNVTPAIGIAEDIGFKGEPRRTQ